MTTPLLQCPSCSAGISVDSRFCPSCGHAIESLSEMPTAGAGVSFAAAAPKLARHFSSGSIPVGGFTPGAILDGRYRIIGLLGRGGMGEVYRAHDLRPGQPAGLKFLPENLHSDPVRLAQFHNEVRTARQVSHAN